MTPNAPQPDDGQESYGHPYGRAPQGGGRTLSAVYRFILVWLTTALILWFGSRMFGFERGDVAVAVVSLVVSLAAAIGITSWLKRRG